MRPDLIFASVFKNLSTTFLPFVACLRRRAFSVLSPSNSNYSLSITFCFLKLLFKLSTVCLSSGSPELSTLTSVCSTCTSVLGFFSGGLYYVKFWAVLVLRTTLTWCFLWLVVVLHINSRTWMIHGRLSIYKMFGTKTLLPSLGCQFFSVLGFFLLMDLTHSFLFSGSPFNVGKG